MSRRNPSCQALLAGALLLTGCGDVSGPGGVDSPRLELVWSEEFTGPAGMPPSAERWNFDVGGDGWGNQQLEFDTDRPENAALDGAGNLAITARAEVYQQRSYTSARLQTQGKFMHQYGRLEARIKLPTGRGIWPAFWTLGDNYDEVGWPECGEIDIMEGNGSLPRVSYGSLHGPGYSGGSSLTSTYMLPSGARFSDDFHVFAIDWSPQGIRWLVDGAPYASRLATSIPSGRRWVYDHPFFLLLNVAVGGTFVGPPDGSTSFPQTMLVDYVRAYDRLP